jgi:hypothetical protein
MKKSSIALLAGGLLLNSVAFADVTYQETSQITGGSMVGMLKLAGAFSSQAKQLSAPTTSTVSIHGSRMLRSNPHTSEIIDLDQQNITYIDHDKRTWYVVTFQQLQDQMAKAAASMKNGQQPSSNGAQMTFNAHVSSNGTTRDINGQTAKESLITITMVGSDPNAPNTKAGMAATSEMWLIDDAPGLAEVRSFSTRMAKELAFDTNSGITSLLGTQPGGAQAMAELKKEAAKQSGFPVLQTTRVGLTADGQPLPAPSTQPLPPGSQAKGASGSGVAQEVATETATQTATQSAENQISRLGTFGRALGGSSMGALMRHAPSPKAAPGQAPAAGTVDPATAGVLLENQLQTSGFSEGPVDAATFQVPAGYKQVTSPMEHK